MDNEPQCSRLKDNLQVILYLGELARDGPMVPDLLNSRRFLIHFLDVGS